MGIVFVVLGNIVTIVCFTILSISFENPWLVLLGLFFFQGYKEPEYEAKNDEK